MRHSGAVITFFFVFAAIFFISGTVSGAADPNQYISFDEVKTDMKAWCLTVFSGTEVEKFDLKILSVVRGQIPGDNMILVEGVDERFQHVSAVHGCSGSPVFIDGRLAGALAAGWDGALDSLYLVRPIENMLKVGTAGADADRAAAGSIGYDFSEPLSLQRFYVSSVGQLQGLAEHSGTAMPLACSIPDFVCREYAPAFDAFAMKPVGFGGLLPSTAVEDAGAFERGGVLALVLCGGDISMAATGTVTEIVDDQLYGFGHAFRGQGPVNFPIAAGQVHTVVASRVSSFKFSSPGPVLGTLEFDQAHAIRGTIGKVPDTIPLYIEVGRFNDPQYRKYDCYVAVDRQLTPLIVQAAVSGAAQMQGPLPLEHRIRYTSRVELEDGTAIVSDNLSSGKGISEVVQELYAITGLVLNNPFGDLPIHSIETKMDIQPAGLEAALWQVDVSEVTVRPGRTITLSAVLKSYRAQEETVSLDFTVPVGLAAGTYKIQLIGASEYQAWVSKMMPQKFRAYDLPTLKKGLCDLLRYPNNRLYAVMQVPTTGLVMRQHELGDLPPTKMLLMQDAKRLRPLEPYQSWVESSIETDTIISGTAEIEITVKQ